MPKPRSRPIWIHPKKSEKMPENPLDAPDSRGYTVQTVPT